MFVFYPSFCPHPSFLLSSLFPWEDSSSPEASMLTAPKSLFRAQIFLLSSHQPTPFWTCPPRCPFIISNSKWPKLNSLPLSGLTGCPSKRSHPLRGPGPSWLLPHHLNVLNIIPPFLCHCHWPSVPVLSTALPDDDKSLQKWSPTLKMDLFSSLPSVRNSLNLTTATARQQ